MAIKVFFKENGPFALVDTLDDAAELMKRGTVNVVKLPVAGTTELAEPEAFLKFWHGINSNARRFLVHLSNYPDGIEGEVFAEGLNLAVEKFGGVMGGASKIAKKYKINPTLIIESEMRVNGGRRYRWLCPGRLLFKYKDQVVGKLEAKVAEKTFGGRSSTAKSASPLN